MNTWIFHLERLGALKLALEEIKHSQRVSAGLNFVVSNTLMPILATETLLILYLYFTDTLSSKIWSQTITYGYSRRRLFAVGCCN